MSLALWLVIYLLLAFVVGRLFEVSLGWKTVSYVFYPGMLIAALGRLLACLVGQQKPATVDLMRSRGPTASSESLPGGHVFRFCYALGPFVATLTAFLVAWHLLDRPIGFGDRLPQLDLDASAAEQSASTLGSFLTALVEAMGDQRLGNWRWWAFLYLGFAFIVASAPSKDDLVSVTAFAAIVGLVVFGLTQAGVDVVTARVYGGSFWGGFSFLVAMALFVLAASAVGLLPLKLLRRSKEN